MIRPAMAVVTLLAASLGVTLFVVKYQVQDLENELIQVNRDITEERQAIHVLKAEWSHLNEPARLRQLSERYLGLEPVTAKQVGTADEWFVSSLPGINGAAPLATSLSVGKPAPTKEPRR